jgi:phenylacetate-CoA ligase
MVMETIKIIDLLTGKTTYKYYTKYKETQWFNRDEMIKYQISKLRKLIHHCYVNVPYYTNIMKERKINPKAVESMNYIQQFPILTKEIIKENYELFIPINSNNIKGIKTSPTGGTTGSILNKRNDANTRSSIWGSYRRFYDWMGITPGDMILTYWGGHIRKPNYREHFKNLLSNKLRNTISFNAYDTCPNTIDLIIKCLKSGKIKLIQSYPQALYTLALQLRERGNSFKIKAIMTTSEPLMPQHRELFREVFNCEAYDQYGCGEIGGIAYECEAHNGLHITEERVYLEINENNELLITDLDNFAMPFIRYYNGDQAEFASEDCLCGRKSKVMKRILGRTCDYLLCRNGQSLHWAYFWHLLFDTEIALKRNFKKFQIVQKSEDFLLFRYVGDKLTKLDEGILLRMIREKMGDIKIDFIKEDDIECSISGKYRPVINELIINNY